MYVKRYDKAGNSNSFKNYYIFLHVCDNNWSFQFKKFSGMERFENSVWAAQICKWCNNDQKW